MSNLQNEINQAKLVLHQLPVAIAALSLVASTYTLCLPITSTAYLQFHSERQSVDTYILSDIDHEEFEDDMPKVVMELTLQKCHYQTCDKCLDHGKYT